MSVLPISYTDNNYLDKSATQISISNLPDDKPSKVTGDSIAVIKDEETQKIITSDTITNLDEKLDEKLNGKFITSQTRAYRAYLVSQIFNKISDDLTLLNNMGSGNPKAMFLIVQIKSNLNSTWNIISSNDDKEAYVVNAFENLLNTNFWKSFSSEHINTLSDLILNYETYSLEVLQEIYSRLLEKYSANIMPHLSN